MYEIIYGALKEVGLDGKYEPQDYLNFFCLGNREAEETPGTSSGPFSASNPQARLIFVSTHVAFRINRGRTGDSWCTCTPRA